MLKNQWKWVFLSIINIGVFSPAFAKTYNLNLSYKTVNFTGTPARAIAVNGQVPGPTLYFKEGDTVNINVYNHLDTGATVHWHGLLVPWRMDGVAWVTQVPIPPGGVYHYHYTLKQAGTYWYHAHSDLQEQEGLYGAIVIEPKHERYHYTKDYPIVLSDWINTDADKVYNNLKKTGDFYTVKFPLQPSLVQFIKDYSNAATPQAKQQILSAYWMMQKSRMSVYDLSDIAYDTFLLNGHPPTHPWIGQVKKGDIVRLRIIDAGASTIFHVKIPGHIIKIIHVDGNDVKPYDVHNFTIAPGETFDVLVKITNNQPYYIYAESIDTLSHALGVLQNNPHTVGVIPQIQPFPKPKPQMMHMGSSHMKMAMPMKTTTDTKYQKLVSPFVTNNPNLPVTVIHIKLSGYMDKYMWFLNGLPEYKAKPILIQPGHRYRIIFTNDTMMHHPMHLHGHWFILRNGHGAHDPLLHTIDVGPGQTIVADFDANTDGQWYFHCHNLFHMKAGMANIVRYQDTHPTKNAPAEPFAQLNGEDKPTYVSTTYLDAGSDFDGFEQVTFKYMYGSDYNKLQLYTNEAEMDRGTVENADMDIFYWHNISQFWAIKGGVNYFYRPADTPYLQPGVGIEGLMPFFIDTDLRVYNHAGSTKADLQLGRDTQITNRFFVGLELRGIAATKTLTNDDIGSGLNQLEYTIKPFYQLNPNLALYVQYEYTRYYGETRNLIEADGQSGNQAQWTVGFKLLI